MKKLLFFFALIVSVSLITSCGDDDSDHMDDPQYSITFNSPNTDDKHVNDSIHIHVDFISGNDQTVHHVNVRIYNKDTGEEVYNGPGDAHVHGESGKHEHHDDFVLSEANGVDAHTDWIMEAKVWGHEAGVAEVLDSIEFHVHPE